MKLMIGSLVLFAAISVSHARKPAVLPVTGLSIEEYKHPVNPGGPDKVGFDFTKGAPRPADISDASEIKALMAAAGAFVVLAPFIYVFMFRRREGAAIATNTVAGPNNVTALPVNRNKTEDRNIKKAS